VREGGGIKEYLLGIVMKFVNHRNVTRFSRVTAMALASGRSLISYPCLSLMAVLSLAAPTPRGSAGLNAGSPRSPPVASPPLVTAVGPNVPVVGPSVAAVAAEVAAAVARTLVVLPDALGAAIVGALLPVIATIPPVTAETPHGRHRIDIFGQDAG
jgi:hypothetical protein